MENLIAEAFDKMKGWASSEIEKAKIDAEIATLQVIADQLRDQIVALQAKRAEME